MSTINLLPEDYLRHALEQRTNTICLVLFAVVMSGVVGATVVSEQNLHNTAGVLRRVNGDYAAATRMIEQIHELEAQKGELLRKAELASTLMERVPRSTLLAVVTNALPKNAAVTGLKMETVTIITKEQTGEARKSKFEELKEKRTKVKAGTPLPQKNVTMEITGLAATDVEVARFIANLARNPMMSGVDLVYSQEKTLELGPSGEGEAQGRVEAKVQDKDRPKLVVREFQVKVDLKPSADALDMAREARQVPAPSTDPPRPAGEPRTAAQTGPGGTT